MDRIRDKRGKYTKLSDKEKALVAQKVGELSLDGLSMTKIAQRINVPRMTLQRIISKDAFWSEFLKKKQAVLKAKMIESLEKDLKAQARKRKQARFAELSLSIGIKHDKIWPPTSQPLAQVNAGDRMIKVYYPHFHEAKQEAEEGQVEPPLQARQEARLKQPLRGSRPKVRGAKATTTRRSD